MKTIVVMLSAAIVGLAVWKIAREVAGEMMAFVCGLVVTALISLPKIIKDYVDVYKTYIESRLRRKELDERDQIVKIPKMDLRWDDPAFRRPEDKPFITWSDDERRRRGSGA